jgi:hypothetical protein
MPVIARAPAIVRRQTGPHAPEARGDLSVAGRLAAQRRPEANSSSSSEGIGEGMSQSKPTWDSLGEQTDFGSQPEAPWVSAFVPPLPAVDSPLAGESHVPRLIARIQSTTAATRWPAPHQMWPAGWRWPEYRLEIDDLDWAVSEIVSALDSMRCPVRPITPDGHWWS